MRPRKFSLLLTATAFVAGVGMTWPASSPAMARIELGWLLFFDPVLSGSGDLSCAHCHHPDLGFADGRQRAMGRGGAGFGPAPLSTK